MCLWLRLHLRYNTVQRTMLFRSGTPCTYHLFEECILKANSCLCLMAQVPGPWARLNTYSIQIAQDNYELQIWTFHCIYLKYACSCPVCPQLNKYATDIYIYIYIYIYILCIMIVFVCNVFSECMLPDQFSLMPSVVLSTVQCFEIWGRTGASKSGLWMAAY